MIFECIKNPDLFIEGFVINEKDLYVNFDKFESGKSNVLLITGLSGSGKSTLAESLAKKYKCDNFELDCLDFYLGGYMDKNKAKKYEPALYDFIEKKQTIIMSMEGNKLGVAMVHPDDNYTIREVSLSTGRSLNVYCIPTFEFEKYLKEYLIRKKTEQTAKETERIIP